MSAYSYHFRKWLYRTVTGRELPRETRKARRGPARDWNYRRWIRSLPCCACSSTQYVEAAHTGEDGGTSMKASDYSCVPLCAWCHRCGPESYHVIGKHAFERLHGLNFRSLARRLYRDWKLMQMPGN